MAKSGQILLRCESDPFTDPDGVEDFVRSAHLTSLVVAGTCKPGSLVEVARAAESAGIPKFAIQTVRLAVYGARGDGSIAETWALAVTTHVAKASATSFAPLAKKFFSWDTVLGRRKLLFSLLDGLAEAVEDPVVVSDRCAPFHRACRHCSDACYYSAISHAGPVAEIVHEKCVRCGACAAACPTGALQSPAFSDDEYLALLREFARGSASYANPLLVFACESGMRELEEEASSGKGLGEGIVVVKVPCAAALGWSHRVWAAAFNVPALSICPWKDCSNRSEVALAEEAARAASDSLEGSNRTLVAHRTLRGRESISDVCIETARQAIRRSGDGYVLSGPRRQAILALPPSLLHSAPVRSRSLNTFEIVVNDRCVMCGMCSDVCPVKAIRTQAGPDGLELRFFPALCTGCNRCVEECPEDAMAASKVFSPSWLNVDYSLVEARDRIELCKGCHKEIGPSLSLVKLRALLLEHGSRELADTVYLCQDCKRKRFRNQ